MKKIYFKDLENYFDKEIEISGFVENIRNIKWVQFLVLRDSTDKVQVTIEKSEEKNKEMVELVNTLTAESTIKVTGTLKKNENVRLRGMEFIPTKIEVTSTSDAELPINIHDKDAQLLDQRLDYRWLDLRNEYNFNIFKIQSDMVKFMREFMYSRDFTEIHTPKLIGAASRDFTEIHTPKLIGAASESGADVFEVKYFDKKAYLAQSPQFYKQMAIASGYDKVFEVAPVFRAENSNTSRHTTEFTGFDVEFAYIDSYRDVMDLEEELLTYTLEKLNEKYGELVKKLYDKEIVVPKEKFPRVKLADLYDELEKRYDYKVDESEKTDLTTEAERLSYRYAMDEFNSEFIFVTDFPKEKRAFYHMRKDDVPEGYDLIYRGVEITTGAEREHRYDVLVKQAKEKGLDKDVEFYLEFFKYGCPPHGGFGLGVDRLTMLVLGLPSVKESMLIFRGPNRLNP